MLLSDGLKSNQPRLAMKNSITRNFRLMVRDITQQGYPPV